MRSCANAWRVAGFLGRKLRVRPGCFFFFTRVALKNRFSPRKNVDVEGALVVFFSQDGDVLSEILFYLKQIRSMVDSLCDSIC